MKNLVEFINESKHGKWYNEIKTIMCLKTEDIPGKAETLVPTSKSEFEQFIYDLKNLTKDIIFKRISGIEQNNYIEALKDIMQYSNWWFDCYEASDTYGEIVDFDDQEKEMLINALNDSKNDNSFLGRAPGGVMEFMFI